MFERSTADDREQAFQFKSVFRYSKLPSGEEQEESPADVRCPLLDTLIRNSVIGFFYTFFLLTFPLSVWFCLKRVKPLERCIVYRLGKRLPLRGPGYIVCLPCIDTVDFIDLKPQKVTIAKDEHILTSDGSIVEFNNFQVEISVSNALKSFTRLKDSRYNVEQFIKISFMNMLGSNHVEDIERKLEYIVKVFVDNCNSYINNWGWTLAVEQLPQVKVIQRAEPQNPVISALKSYFGIKDPEQAVQLKMNGFKKSDPDSVKRPNSEADRVITALQTIANKHSSLNVFGLTHVNIALSIRETSQTDIYQFTTKSGELVKQSLGPEDRLHLTIIANNVSDLMEFLEKEDTSKVEIKTHLL